MTRKIVSSGHSLKEDIFSILQAILVFSMGVMFFESAELIGGGTTGVALMLSYITDVNFGWWFVLVNIPFFTLGIMRMGLKFTLSSIICVVSVSFVVDNLSPLIQLNFEHKIIPAVFAGLFFGVALLILFRHRSSMGGINILALFLQENKIMGAGIFQFIFDSILMVVCFYLFDFMTVLHSAIALAILNIILIINHKEDRYSPNKTK